MRGVIAIAARRVLFVLVLALVASSSPRTLVDAASSSSSSAASSTTSTRGLTDASPLATRDGIPDASLCEHGDAGHRRATTMGDAHLKQRKPLLAEACYLGALRYKSDFPMALYGLGEAHVMGDRDALAAEAYALAIDAWPQYVDARIALGELKARGGDAIAAEAAFRGAVAIAPTDALAWEALGKHLLSIGARDRAHDAYERASASVPGGRENVGLLFGRARVAAAKREWRACVESAAAASARAGGAFADAAFLSGECEARLGCAEASRAEKTEEEIADGERRVTSGLRRMKDAIAMDDDEPGDGEEAEARRVTYATLLEECAKRDDAIDAVNDALRAHPDSEALRALRASLNAKRKREAGEL